MKILHIIASVDPKNGGPGEGVRQIDRALTSMGHITHVLSLDSPSLNLFDLHPGAVYSIGGSDFLNYKYSKCLYSWLVDNGHQYDVFVINGLWQYHSYGAWKYLKDSGKPYYVFSHGMLDPWFNKTYPLKYIKKIIYWFLCERKVLRDAKAVLFTCEEEKILARNSFHPYEINELVPGYGTSRPKNTDAYYRKLFFKEYENLVDKKILLFISRIDQKKGCDLLIDAFAKVVHRDPRLELVIAGPDKAGWGDDLRKIAKKHGVNNRITWTGMLNGDMKWGAFYASEVFILPSHQENFGIVVAEALACGKPVLITNKVNIWREIVAENSGFVSNDDLDGTVDNIDKWLSLSDNEYRAMSDRAKLCFDRHFLVDAVAKKLEAIFAL